MRNKVVLHLMHLRIVIQTFTKRQKIFTTLYSSFLYLGKDEWNGLNISVHVSQHNLKNSDCALSKKFY